MNVDRKIISTTIERGSCCSDPSTITTNLCLILINTLYLPSTVPNVLFQADHADLLRKNESSDTNECIYSVIEIQLDKKSIQILVNVDFD